MPRALWCNLDPARPFAELVQDHCLDLLADGEVWVWNLESPGQEPRGPWPDWPWAVSADRLLEALEDLPPRGHLDAPPILLLHLPGNGTTRPGASAGDPNAGLLARQIAEWASGAGWDLVATLPPSAHGAEPAALLPGARLLVRLAAGSELQRLHAERLLLEWLLDPELGPELGRRPGDTGPVAPRALHLRSARRELPLDWVAQEWGARIPGLLDEVSTLLQGAGSVGQGADARGGLLRALKDAESIRDSHSTEAQGGLSRDARAALRPRLPLFHRRALASEIAEGQRQVQERLDAALAARVAELTGDHQALAEQQAQQERALARELDAIPPVALGFGRLARDGLRDLSARCQGIADDTQKRATTLFGHLGEDLAQAETGPEARYLRPHLPEDDALDAAIATARDRAGQLPRLRRLLLGLGVASAVAMVPVIAVRLPAWIIGGLGAYLAQPDLWLADLAWLLLPGAALGLGTLVFALHRRRLLALALGRAEDAAQALWRRNLGILADSFRYARHMLALRRVDLVQTHARRLTRETAEGRAALQELEQALSRQRERYARLGAGTDMAGRGGLPRLERIMTAGSRPRDWIGALAAALPRPPDTEIEVHDGERIRGAKLASRYLRGYQGATLADPADDGAAP